MKIKILSLFLIVVLLTLNSSKAISRSSSLTDREGDVILDDTGSLDVSLGQIYDAPYLDIIEFSYEISTYPDPSQLVVSFKETPVLVDVGYVIRFEGYTGQIEGADASIEALDTLADFIIEIEPSMNIWRLDFYNAANPNQIIEDQNFTTEILGNQLLLNFISPELFDISKVMDQENLIFYASVSKIIDDKVASDIISNDSDLNNDLNYLILKYWFIALLLIIFLVLISYLLIKKFHS